MIPFKIIGLARAPQGGSLLQIQGGRHPNGPLESHQSAVGTVPGHGQCAQRYLVLISLLIYIGSYVTTQMVTGGDVPTTVKLLNSAGKDLQSSGMAKVTAAIDPMPASFYQTADLVGLIYHNDLLEGRLSRYPAFLSLGERPGISGYRQRFSAFTELRQRQPPIHARY